MPAGKNAPGTRTDGGVRSAMDSPFKRGASVGSGNNMRAPFDESKASSRMPTKIYEREGRTAKTPAPGGLQGMGGLGKAPSAQGPVRRGAR